MIDLTLVHYAHSSCSWRVRIALAHKGLGPHYEALDVSPGCDEQDTDAYGQRNPMRQVPLLEWQVEGRPHRLSQSLAIMTWLDRQYPSPALVPSDPYLAAKVLEFAEMINAGIQPLQNNRVQAAVERLAGGEGMRWARAWVEKGFRALEALVGDVGSEHYCVGDAVSLADVCLIPQVHNARKLGVDLGAYPRLVAIEAHCASLPSFQAAHPERWSA